MDDHRRANVALFQTKADAAYAELRRRIMDGTVAPGSTVNQGQLALEFGFSTTPLREAIRRLESEGLVSLTAHKDVVATSLDTQDVVDVYEVRERLDAIAARFAADRHTSEEALEIEAARDALTATTPDPLFLNRAFHRAIYRACHNKVLVDQLEALWDRSDRHRRILWPIAMEQVVVEEHNAIADAVLKRKGVLAARLMKMHVHNALQSIQERGLRERS